MGPSVPVPRRGAKALTLPLSGCGEDTETPLSEWFSLAYAEGMAPCRGAGVLRSVFRGLFHAKEKKCLTAVPCSGKILPMHTKLRSFMDRHSVPVGELADKAALSRRQLTNLRKGTSEPTISTARDLASALTELTGKRVRVADIFDLTVALPERRAS